MVLAFALLLASAPGPWDAPRRGSWLEASASSGSGPLLVRQTGPETVLVVPKGEKSCVRQAAAFLAEDLQKISGRRAVILDRKVKGAPFVEIRTRPSPEWESYRIRTVAGGIEITGSNPRGTAFGVYELCERLGVDPLHRWTGYEPERHLPLVVKKTDFRRPPPAVRYRGLFHDDEDIFPIPKLPQEAADGLVGTPAQGTVPIEKYKWLFETALRLRMNMVAPWVRTNRYFEVQKLASDWGLYYTSHHYDTLLSDPYHFTRTHPETPLSPFRKGLAELRGVKPEWDFVGNRDGMVRFWKGGVDENHEFDCIWPIGLRGTNDFSYRWPEGFAQDQILAQYEDALRAQVELVKAQVPQDRERLFHFTMYTEMLPYYQTGKLKVPDEAIIVWPDNNDGMMRGLPGKDDKHRHGVYYHLAYLGGNISKQTAQVVPLERIEAEFRRIFEAGAKEFMLVNVSELREYVLGARFIADLCWEGGPILASQDAADHFLEWWCREYFGSEEAAKAAEAYRDYFASIPTTPDFGYGAQKCLGAIPSLRLKLEGKPFSPALPETLPTLSERRAIQRSLQDKIDEAYGAIRGGLPKRFFFENLMLPAAIDRLTTEAGWALVKAMNAPTKEQTLAGCLEAKSSLDALDGLLRQAERPPFEGWYGPAWTGQRNAHIVLPKLRLDKLLTDFGKAISKPSN